MSQVGELIRIDNSGIFAIPEGFNVENLIGISIGGIFINEPYYTITENGNIDIISLLTSVPKYGEYSVIGHFK